jgi:hypothetical protein
LDFTLIIVRYFFEVPVFKFLKVTIAVVGLWISLPFFAVLQPLAGIALAALILAVCVIALFKPLPQIGLSSRTIIFTILFLVALPGLALTSVSLKDQTDWAGLKASDPDAYLTKLEDHDYKKYLAELKVMKPEAFEALRQEAVAARQQAAKEAKQQEAQKQAQKQAQVQAEATEQQSKEDARKAKMAAKTKRMTDSIAAALRQHYGIEPQPLFPGSPLCWEDGYCDFEANSIRIQVYGAGLAVVETTDQVSRTDYLEMCSVVFAGISGANENFAGETIGMAYGRALNAGSFKQDVSDVQIKITPDLGNQLGCRFFKYGN